MSGDGAGLGALDRDADPAGIAPATGRRAGDATQLKTLRLIVNPTATTVTHKRADQVAAILGRRFDVDVTPTVAPGHATELAAEAVAAGTDVVAVYSGDGTTNEAIRALAGTSTALLHLAGGNSSVLARTLGLGADAIKAARRMATAGEPQLLAIDLGDADGRPFAFTAGVGLDAAVVRLVDGDLARKHRFRWGAFFMEAVRLANTDYVGAPSGLTITTAEGESVRGITAIIQNGEAYTYVGPRPLRVGDGASLTSGTLACTALLSGLSFADIPRVAGRIIGPLRTTGSARVHGLSASAGPVTVTCDRPTPLQVDGDFWRDVTEVTFSVRAGALRVLR